MKNNNKGYTLIELIIVMAIIAVIITTLSYSMSIVFRNRSREAASDFNALLSATKMATLSGEYYEIPGETSADPTTYHSPKLVMRYIGGAVDEYTAELYTTSSTEATQVEDLGAGNLGIKYSITGVDAVTNVEVTGTSISFTYNKETGALDTFNDKDVSGYDTIVLDFGANYVITIYPSTGYQEYT